MKNHKTFPVCFGGTCSYLFLPQRLIGGNEFGDLGEELRSRGVENATGKLETVLKAKPAQDYILWLTHELTRRTDADVRRKVADASTQALQNVEDDMPVKNTERIIWFLNRALSCVPAHLQSFARQKIDSWEKLKTEIPVAPSFRSARDVTRNSDAALVRLSAMAPTTVSIRTSLQTPSSSVGLVDAIYNYCRDKFTGASLQLSSVDFARAKTEIQEARTPTERAQKIQAILTSLLEEYQRKANAGNNIPSLEAGLRNQLALYGRVIGDLARRPETTPPAKSTAPAIAGIPAAVPATGTVEGAPRGRTTRDTPAAAPAEASRTPAAAPEARPAPKSAAAVAAPRGGRRAAAEAATAKEPPAAPTGSKSDKKAPAAPAATPAETAREKVNPKIERAAQVTRAYVEAHGDKITPYGFGQVFNVNLTDGSQKIYDAVLAKQKAVTPTSTDKRLQDGTLGDVTYGTLSLEDKTKLKQATPATPAAAPAAMTPAHTETNRLEEEKKKLPAISLPERPNITLLPVEELQRAQFYKVENLEDLSPGDKNRIGSLKNNDVVTLTADGYPVDKNGERIGLKLPLEKFLASLDPKSNRDAIVAYKLARYQAGGPNARSDVQQYLKQYPLKNLCIYEGRFAQIDLPKSTTAGKRFIVSTLFPQGKEVDEEELRTDISKEDKDAFTVLLIERFETARIAAEKRALQDDTDEFARRIALERNAPTKRAGQEAFNRATLVGTLTKETPVTFISEKTGRELRQPLATLPPNTQVAVIGQVGNKYKIATQEGLVGFIPQENVGGNGNLALKQTTAAPTATAAAPAAPAPGPPVAAPPPEKAGTTILT